MRSKVLQPYFLLALLAIFAILAFFIVQPFLTPLILAGIFAVVMRPVYMRMVRMFGGRESMAALSTALIFAALVIIPAGLVGTQIVLQAQDLYTAVTERGAAAVFDPILSGAEQTLSRYVPDVSDRFEALRGDINTYAQQALNWIVQHLGVAFSGVISVFLDIFIFFVAFYYFLRDGERIVHKLVVLSPLSDRDDKKIANRLYQAVNSVIKGQLLVALIQGTLTGIGLAIFGVPNALLWGLVACVASLIPTLGAGLVTIPAIIFLTLTDSAGSAIGLAIWGVTAVGLIDNFLGPKFMSSGLRLHPLVVMLSVLGGLMLFGPVGLFLGPIAMSLLFALLSIQRDVQQNMDTQVQSVLQ